MEKLLEKLTIVEELMGKLFVAHTTNKWGSFNRIQREINKKLFDIRLDIITETENETQKESPQK